MGLIAIRDNWRKNEWLELNKMEAWSDKTRYNTKKLQKAYIVKR